MGKYYVTIDETISEEFEISADNIETAHRKYNNG